MTIRAPIEEETIDIKIERASTTKTKSKPRTSVFLMMSSPPLRAKGISSNGNKAVAKAMTTDQIDLARFDSNVARGMVNEPMIGTKIVNRVIVSVVIKEINYTQKFIFVKDYFRD